MIILLFSQQTSTVRNDITSVDEATQFYPLFAVFGQVAPIVSGYVMKYIVVQQPVDSPDGGFGQTLQALAMIKVMCGIAIVVLYNLCTGPSIAIIMVLIVLLRRWMKMSQLQPQQLQHRRHKYQYHQRPHPRNRK